MLTYALVTPARNKAENLRRLGAVLIEQSVVPADGSSSMTIRPTTPRRLWMTCVRVTTGFGCSGRIRGEGRCGSRTRKAHRSRRVCLLARSRCAPVGLGRDRQAGRGRLIRPDFFERLLSEFEADPALGIAGGSASSSSKVNGGHTTRRATTSGARRAPTGETAWNSCGHLPHAWDGTGSMRRRQPLADGQPARSRISRSGITAGSASATDAGRCGSTRAMRRASWATGSRTWSRVRSSGPDVILRRLR